MGNKRIEGVIVPILTPLTPDEEVDVTSLRRLVDYLLRNGVHGIWAGGTTGEFAALSEEQWAIAIETVVNETAGRVPVIGNISAAGTKLAVGRGLSVQEMGLDGIAATPPYYYDCAQDELLDHYRRIKDGVGLPLWVYNIPATVKTVVAPATVAQLASEGSVVGIKDSSGAGELLGELNVLCEQMDVHLLRFLGTIFRATNTSGVGAHGVIPGIANLVPRTIVKAWEAGQAGDVGDAREHMAKLMVAGKIRGLTNGGSPVAASLSGMKSALKIMGVIDHDVVSRPLRPLDEEEKRSLPAILRELELVD